MVFRFFFLFLSLCACLPPHAASAAPAPGTGWPTHLKVFTGPSSSQWFLLGDSIAEALSKNVVPSTCRIGGGLANIDSLDQGTGDLSFSLVSFLLADRSGVEEYKYVRLDNVTLMANLYPQVLYFLLRKEVAEKYGVTTVEGLLQLEVPLRFASLKPGTASEFILALLLKYGYGTSFAKLRELGWIISFNNYPETADSLASGELDCFAFTEGAAAPFILTLEEHADLVILPVERSALALLSEKFKTGIHTIEPGAYKCVKEPVLTLGDWACILVRKDLPPDMVFAINKTLWEERVYLAGVIKDFCGFSPVTALPEGVAAHPGSVAFWNNLRR